MSVLIKGLKMPKGCLGCPCINSKYNECMILQRRATDVMTRMADCPLVELSDHGDLIDRNMLIGGFADWYIQESPMYLGDNKVVAETIGEAMKAIETAPVVITAERSKE